VLTVISGRSDAGQRAAASHTAAAATPLVTQEALFGQAGIIAATNLGELLEAAALLASQPLPLGDRVAIVSNAGGGGVLAADACADHGLRVAMLSGPTQRRLQGLLPTGAATAGPVDTTAAIGVDAFGWCLREVAADDGVDAVLAVTVPTAMADPSQALATAGLAKPLAAAVLDQMQSVRLLPAARTPAPGEEAPGDETTAAPPVPGIPAYAYPESAARALGHAARYHAWRIRQQGRVPELSGVRADEARAQVSAFLAASPAGGWLGPAEAGTLLACYQITPPGRRPAGAAAAVGVEVFAGVRQEAVFGPLVVFGLSGIAGQAIGDCTARLTPLTDTDAADMIHDGPAAPVLAGPQGRPAADTGALAGLLLRVSRLADDLPEVAELDLDPVIAGPDGPRPVAARIRLSPGQPQDPFLRRLR